VSTLGEHNYATCEDCGCRPPTHPPTKVNISRIVEDVLPDEPLPVLVAPTIPPAPVKWEFSPIESPTLMEWTTPLCCGLPRRNQSLCTNSSQVFWAICNLVVDVPPASLIYRDPRGRYFPYEFQWTGGPLYYPDDQCGSFHVFPLDGSAEYSIPFPGKVNHLIPAIPQCSRHLCAWVGIPSHLARRIEYSELLRYLRKDFPRWVARLSRVSDPLRTRACGVPDLTHLEYFPEVSKLAYGMVTYLEGKHIGYIAKHRPGAYQAREDGAFLPLGSPLNPERGGVDDPNYHHAADGGGVSSHYTVYTSYSAEEMGYESVAYAQRHNKLPSFWDVGYAGLNQSDVVYPPESSMWHKSTAREVWIKGESYVVRNLHLWQASQMTSVLTTNYIRGHSPRSHFLDYLYNLPRSFNSIPNRVPVRPGAAQPLSWVLDTLYHCPSPSWAYKADASAADATQVPVVRRVLARGANYKPVDGPIPRLRQILMAARGEPMSYDDICHVAMCWGWGAWLPRDVEMYILGMREVSFDVPYSFLGVPRVSMLAKDKK